MSKKNAVKNLELGFFNVASLTGTPTLMVNGFMTESCFAIRISNDSNVAVQISYDGVTAHDVVLAQGVLFINLLNSADRDVNFAKGAGIYVSGTAGTGFIYFGGYYLASN